MFVVTGRKEDVGAAKREILSAAEHFSQIRASRRNNNSAATAAGSVGGCSGGGLPPGPPSPITPGQVTIQVRVPYRVVGLVVGPKGATIKRIQQQTHTYIVTPSRDKEPIFEVTGLPESVEKARQEIESHIAVRTGGMVDGNASAGLPCSNNINTMNMQNNSGSNRNTDHNDFHQNGIDAGFHEINGDMISSMYKPPSSNSAFTSYSTLNHSNNILSQSGNNGDTSTANIFAFPPAPMNGSATKMGEFSGLNNGYSGPGYGLYESSDEGIGSPTLDNGPLPPAPTSTSIWSNAGVGESENGSQLSTVFAPINSSGTVALAHRSSSMPTNTSPGTTSFSPPLTSSDHSSVRRIHSDPCSGGAGLSAFMPLTPSSQSGTSASISSSTSASPTDSTGSLGRRRCLVCGESDVVAALVPCGHNLFCIDCANTILEKPETERQCPICQQTPTQAIRIFS